MPRLTLGRPTWMLIWGRAEDAGSRSIMPTTSWRRIPVSCAHLGPMETPVPIGCGALQAGARVWRAPTAPSTARDPTGGSDGDLLGKRAVAELLAAHADLGHQASLGVGEDAHALDVLGVRRRPGRGGHRAHLGG